MQRQLTDSPRVSIEGVLERVVFQGEDGFVVARLQVAARRRLVTIVGNIMSAIPGETLRLRGEWAFNPKFGEQFRVESCLSVLPETVTGIQKYLASGLIRGIGPVMAKRMVERFGLETLDVVEETPERLLEVEGIGPTRKESIARAWSEQKGIREVMVFLQGHGVSSAHAARIYRQYGDQSVQTVTQDPYRLAQDISGIGFKTADKIARSLGIDPGSEARARAGLLYILSWLVDEGHVYCPEDELLDKTRVELGIEPDTLAAALQSLRHDDRVVVEEVAGGERAVYLKPLFMAELNAARYLHDLLDTPRGPLQIDVERAIEWVQQKNGITLAEMQKEAVRRAVTGKVVVITGGPGTGKTTVVRSILQVLETKGQKALLASPTGRAAKRLAEVTGREARTIHRLLEFNPSEGDFKRGRESPLECDLLVVDEASMLDVLLMNRLVQAVPRHAALLLVGDADQLPSVGPGNVLRDIIDSGAVDVVRLNEVFRQASTSQIVVNAHRVNRGEFPALDGGPQSDFFFIERKEPEAALAAIKELCAQRLSRAFHLDPARDVQVITPMHKGEAGVTNLNRELQALLNPSGPEITGMGRMFRAGDRVMQVENDYQKEVFNGDIGTVASVDRVEGELFVDYDGKCVKYEAGELDQLVPAYAISVHKSQGSEYEAVVMPLLTQHYVMLQRNLLYTAMTRARRLFILVGTKKALAIAIKNATVQKRFTALRERLASRRRSGCGPGSPRQAEMRM